VGGGSEDDGMRNRVLYKCRKLMDYHERVRVLVGGYLCGRDIIQEVGSGCNM
jgi:hypothetical protein